MSKLIELFILFLLFWNLLTIIFFEMSRRKLKTVGRYVGYERNREDFGFFDYYFKVSKSVIISIICIPFSLYFFFIKHFVEKNRIKWFKPKKH